MSDTQKSSQERAVKWIYSAQEAIDKCNELERENAELKQKAEAAENLLLTIQAWDIDKHELRGHQCLAKQWICSFQDRINRYKRGKK